MLELWSASQKRQKPTQQIPPLQDFFFPTDVPPNLPVCLPGCGSIKSRRPQVCLSVAIARFQHCFIAVADLFGEVRGPFVSFFALHCSGRYSRKQITPAQFNSSFFPHLRWQSSGLSTSEHQADVDLLHSNYTLSKLSFACLPASTSSVIKQTTPISIFSP